MASFDSSLTNQDSRWSHDRAFIQQTIAPHRYVTRPPAIQHPTAVYKKLDADLTYVVNQMPGPTAPPQSCVVPNGRGLIMWYPKDGTDTILHMGIIPQGSFVNRELTAGFAQGFVANSLTNTGYFWGPNNITAGLFGLHFTRALAVPRLDVPLKISPDLGASFSRSRLYGGMFRVWSNTIAIGNTALNGTVTCCVVSDSRDIAQNENGSDAFAVVDQAQSARTVKEIVKEISANIGVVTVQGSDISPNFTAPDALNNVRIEGGWTQPISYNTLTKHLDFANAVAPGQNYVQPVFTSWYSPWGVNQKEGFNIDTVPETAPITYSVMSGILPGQANALPEISEMGTMQVKFDIGAYFTNVLAPATYPSIPFSLVSIVEHVFVGIQDSTIGNLQVNILRTVKRVDGDMWSWSLSTSPAPGSQIEKNNWHDFGHVSSIDEQYIKLGGASVVGKFVGCKASAFFVTPFVSQAGMSATLNCGTYAPANTRAASIGLNYDDVVTGPQISFFASDINLDGKCGPLHLVRYDDIGQGQTIRIQGILNTESVAKGDLAPYVQDQVMNSKLAPDANVLPLTYMLYNGNGPFKMSWNAQDYDDFVEQYVRNLTPESIADLADGDTRIKAAMQAAGLFSGILGGLGGALGGAADSALHLIGARGQFGAVGQFGEDAAMSAGGQYGIGASGQMNAYRRERAGNW